MPKRRAPGERGKILHLVALEAEALVARLAARQAAAIDQFGRERDRGVLLDLLRSRAPTMTFGEVAALTPPQQLAFEQFQAEIDALRWYFRSTTDMPGALRLAAEAARRRVGERHARLVEVLGSAESLRTSPRPRGAMAPVSLKNRPPARRLRG